MVGNKNRSLNIWDGESLSMSCASWRTALRNDPIFARALFISLPPALLAAVVEAVSNYNLDGGVFKDVGLLVNGQVYGVITTLLGFLIVFRNSQAYQRFWEACTVVYQMQAQLFDAASSLVAFCSPKEEKRKEVAAFRHSLIRLLSMLNSLMMAELQHATHGEDVQLRMPVLDAAGLAQERIKFLELHSCKVEIVSQWIQQLTVLQLRKGVVDVPAPIATRAFQEIGAGVLEFHRALKIAEVPFPNTYITSMMVLLGVHMCLTPICMVALVEASGWAFLLTFISIFTLWALALLGLELDSPFKPSFNRNIDLYGLHCQYNERLVSLVIAAHHQAPFVIKGAKNLDALREQCRLDSADPEYHESLSSRRLGHITPDNEPRRGVSINSFISAAEHEQQVQQRHSNLGIQSLNLMEAADSGPNCGGDAEAGTLPTSGLGTSQPSPPPHSPSPEQHFSPRGPMISPALLFDRMRRGSSGDSSPRRNEASPGGTSPQHFRSKSVRASTSSIFKDDPKDSAFHDQSRLSRRPSTHTNMSSGTMMHSASTLSLGQAPQASNLQWVDEVLDFPDGFELARALPPEHTGLQLLAGTPLGRLRAENNGSLSWRSFEREV
mmetsp:Transcript_22808/g.52140  ORF Transcript_22808/g.52140 Transcript_22808/m.52140 type:complete len:609 (-) Transcript_22808:16-1842(-)